MNRKKIRTALHPALMLTFIIMGLTGILMFFHVDPRGLKHLHEWMGLVFLLLCTTHIAINWKAFRVHLKGGPVMATIIIICLLSSLLMLFSGGQGRGNGRGGAGHYRHQARF